MSVKSLFLLPMPLYDGHDDVPQMTLDRFCQLESFITERARTLRRFLSKINHPKPIDELIIIELDKHDPANIISQLPSIFSKHNSVGFASEAGTPCIADPGFRITNWAQKNNIPVVPMPGPNSIIMALMASGFSGQSFQFHGYLSAKKEKIGQDLTRLEALAKNTRSPQVFIEAPYRNKQILQAATQHLNGHTSLHISLDLCTPNVQSITLTVNEWKKKNLDVHKRPAVFVIMQG